MNKRIRHLSAATYMKGNEMVNELKPCPFCGGEASIGEVTYPKDSETAKLNGRYIGYFVNCIICGATCGHGLCYATEEKAVVKWNKRVAENEQQADFMALAKEEMDALQIKNEQQRDETNRLTTIITDKIDAPANERLKEALLRIDNWAKAYPLKVFPEPDFKKVAEALKAAGLSLDAVSASNMRHVINGVKDIVEKALKETND